MGTLLIDKQKQIFLKCHNLEGHLQETKEEKEARESDPFYDYYHERTDSNYNRISVLSPEEFDLLKDFLSIPIDKIGLKFMDLQEFKYCRIETIGDALGIDWVYFPVRRMRRTMLNFFEQLLGCKLNFIIFFTQEQKSILCTHTIDFETLILPLLLLNHKH